ncbi:MAG: cytochrome c maturation protein CcmE [Gemmatimonadetes bacterium]|nr:cytochrome c maturation protein CcmE [Gemmatimonadota bacterium]
MKKQSRFLAGGVLLAGVVGYLMVTGMKDSMTYYLTPAELAQRVSANPSFAEDAGVRVGGQVVPGTVSFDQKTLDLRFVLTDTTGAQHIPVHYTGPLPDTFKEGRGVVVEGRYRPGGTFEAAQVLTKCGSRYEASESDFKGKSS